MTVNVVFLLRFYFFAISKQIGLKLRSELTLKYKPSGSKFKECEIHGNIDHVNIKFCI